VKAKRTKSLSKVLDQSTHVEGLVEQAATELSSVNDTLKKEVAEARPPPALEGALDKSEAAEVKMIDASEQLGVVNEGLKAEVSDQQALQEELVAVAAQSQVDRHAALHDPLTELPNRALFLDRLEQAVAQARRQRWKLAVMFADLDGFKAVNDTYGHQAGDAVLKAIGVRLREGCRADDTVSRHGGDEFLCLQLDVGEDATLELVVRKMIERIEAPIDFRGIGADLTHAVRVSIGVAVFPRDGALPAELIASADQAMYVAKREKRGFAFAMRAER
jgi:diguanylate cyclase (GGDEF)-like protein